MKISALCPLLFFRPRISLLFLVLPIFFSNFTIARAATNAEISTLLSSEFQISANETQIGNLTPSVRGEILTFLLLDQQGNSLFADRTPVEKAASLLSRILQDQSSNDAAGIAIDFSQELMDELTQSPANQVSGLIDMFQKLFLIGSAFQVMEAAPKETLVFDYVSNYRNKYGNAHDAWQALVTKINSTAEMYPCSPAATVVTGDGVCERYIVIQNDKNLPTVAEENYQAYSFANKWKNDSTFRKSLTQWINSQISQTAAAQEQPYQAPSFWSSFLGAIGNAISNVFSATKIALTNVLAVKSTSAAPYPSNQTPQAQNSSPLDKPVIQPAPISPVIKPAAKTSLPPDAPSNPTIQPQQQVISPPTPPAQPKPVNVLLKPATPPPPVSYFPVANNPADIAKRLGSTGHSVSTTDIEQLSALVFRDLTGSSFENIGIKDINWYLSPNSESPDQRTCPYPDFPCGSPIGVSVDYTTSAYLAFNDLMSLTGGHYYEKNVSRGNDLKLTGAISMLLFSPASMKYLTEHFQAPRYYLDSSTCNIEKTIDDLWSIRGGATEDWFLVWAVALSDKSNPVYGVLSSGSPYLNSSQSIALARYVDNMSDSQISQTHNVVNDDLLKQIKSIVQSRDHASGTQGQCNTPDYFSLAL